MTWCNQWIVSFVDTICYVWRILCKWKPMSNLLMLDNFGRLCTNVVISVYITWNFSRCTDFSVNQLKFREIRSLRNLVTRICILVLKVQTLLARYTDLGNSIVLLCSKHKHELLDSCLIYLFTEKNMPMFCASVNTGLLSDHVNVVTTKM